MGRRWTDEMIGSVSTLSGLAKEEMAGVFKLCWFGKGVQYCVEDSALSSLSMWYFSALGCFDPFLLSGSTGARSPTSNPNSFGLWCSRSAHGLLHSDILRPRNGFPRKSL